MARQATLFDETMRQTAERATWRADGLQEDLRDAWATIERLAAENAALRQEVDKLRRDVTSLRTENAIYVARLTALYATFGTETTTESKARVARELTKLAADCHPDHWQGSPVEEECTKAVLRLRDTLTSVEGDVNDVRY